MPDETPVARVNRTSPTLEEVMTARLSRRQFLGFSGMAAAALATTSLWPKGAGATNASHTGNPASPLSFTEIEKQMDTVPHVALGYSIGRVVSWGDPLFEEDGAFDPTAQTPESQSRRIGYNDDYLAYMPLPYGSKNSTHGLLCINHEYTILRLMFAGMEEGTERFKATETQGRIEQEAQGVSVIEIEKKGSDWQPVLSGQYNRRITATTPIEFSGPAAGSERLKTARDPAGKHVVGTLANCAGGVTPWGTVLTCEENIDRYFGNMPENHPDFEVWRRYGIGSELDYGWYQFDPRFDLSATPNEPNRFGWVVEYDPYNPSRPAKKRTALGRFKHECANTTIAPDGRIVIYSGDDQTFEYVYRFVTAKPWNPNDRDANLDLLDEGTLSVARFDPDGSMIWLPLVHGQGRLNAANGFTCQGDVMTFARHAADLVGATPMDRPEDVEVNPVTRQLFVVLTRNDERTIGKQHPANRRGPNPFGHILELNPPKNDDGQPDHTAERFEWEIFLEGGDPANPQHRSFYQNAISEHGWLTNPDNIAFDPAGHLWICTDGQEKKIRKNEGFYAVTTMGPHKGSPKLFFTSPIGAEITGPCFTPDGKTVFLSIQHPGEEPKKSSTYNTPSTRWPDMREDMPPRPTVIAITKDDGGLVGS